MRSRCRRSLNSKPPRTRRCKAKPGRATGTRRPPSSANEIDAVRTQGTVMNRIVVSIAVFLAIGAIAGVRAAGPPLATASPTDPYGDPCKLLTDSEVRSVFPDAKPGVRDRRLEQAGGDI